MVHLLFSRELHPSILTDLGLETAVRAHVVDFGESQGIAVVFRAKDVPRDLPKPVSICLYRVLQEALHNVSKCARTSRLSVALATSRAGNIRLSVRDFGVGMPPELPNRGRGLA